MSDVELVWDADCSVAESPVWDAKTRRVYFRATTAGQPHGRVCAYGVDDGSQQTWELSEGIGSLGICRSGRLIIALLRRLVFFDPVSGKIEDFTGGIDEPEVNRFNDGRPGPDGSYWVGTRDGRRDLPGGNETTVTEPTGSLYRISPDGKITRKAEGILSSNGMTFSPDGKTMYFGDSSNNYVDAWDFDPKTGEIANRRRFITVPVAQGRPDGAAMDADGCYWSSGVTAACVNQYSPAGELLQQIAMPCAAPAMPCFAEDTLFVTSLRGVHAEAVADLSGLPHNIGGLFKMRAPAVGAPVSIFAD